MTRLTYRSLLLSTVISMGNVVYGAGIESSNTNAVSDNFESIRSERSQQSTTQRVWGQSTATAQESKRVERPQEHYCPITQEVMNDPVVASDGFSYEREAIANWIALNETSPMTHQAMSDELHPNQSLKILINEWNPHQKYYPSALSGLSPDEIVKFLEAEYAKNAQLLTPEHTAKDKDIVVFLGNTGAGKSTFINFLAGKGLKVVEDEEYVLEDVKDPHAMPIGNQAISETLYPKSIDIGHLRFFDLPGFNDTDGSVRNLVNSAFIRRIMLEAKSVRLLYVAGRGQFDADRAESIKKFLEKISKLFVMDNERSDPIKEGLFVVTKENRSLDKVFEKQGLPAQISEWHTRGHTEQMYSASKDEKNNGEHRQKILKRIDGLKSMKLVTLNVSALYPAETEHDLKRMYAKMFEDAYTHKKETPIMTVSEYRKNIEAWKRATFWKEFEDKDFNKRHPAALTLKGVTTVPYQQVRDEFVKGHEGDRQTYINDLERRMNSHIEVLKQKTEARAAAEIKRIRDEQRIDGVIPFDFANHVMYQERVCGRAVLERITVDVEEQEIIRSAFSKWIAQHYQRQLEASIFQKQIDDLKNIHAADLKKINNRIDAAYERFQGHTHYYSGGTFVGREGGPVIIGGLTSEPTPAAEKREKKSEINIDEQRNGSGGCIVQ